MIQSIGFKGLQNNYVSNNVKTNKTPVINNYSTVPASFDNYTATSLVNAYQAFHGINLAKTVSFGMSLGTVFQDFTSQMFTCKDSTSDGKGERVGQRTNVSKIIDMYADDLQPAELNPAIKIDVEVAKDAKNGTKTIARSQIKGTENGVVFEMAVRQPQKESEKTIDKTKPLVQLIQITEDGDNDEQAFVLNTKGNLMTVVEDGNNVLLTNAGHISKKSEDSVLNVDAKQVNNNFRPFTPSVQEVIERTPQESIGEGTDIVIGMEHGRFVPEIIASIEKFVDKVNNGEIVLKQFVANKNANKIQLAMLAGGFGSRAEYTNASSDGIFHDKEDGANSTKGIFETATGLTPMETTFISLHNAGLLDCSKGKLQIGKNIKFYLNESGVNKGNGGFSLDLYNKMEREGRESLVILPNDSMSRMTNATKEMTDIMNSGNAAIAMISKSVRSESAKGNLGIMKLGENNEILDFSEKPKEIPAGYEKDGMCLTNTFQFGVSKEAFKAISLIEPYIPVNTSGGNDESRDWSKAFVPVLMALSQKDDIKDIGNEIEKKVKAKIPESVIIEAKQILGNQKVYSVPTTEPWADCGTLNALYHTTMQIANNDFPLEDFERKHVLDSINTQTGLIASSPEQKAEIEAKYDIEGQVMVVPKAEKVDKSILTKYINEGLVTINPKQV